MIIQNYKFFRISITYRLADVPGLCRWFANSVVADTLAVINASPATPGFYKHFTALICKKNKTETHGLT